MAACPERESNDGMLIPNCTEKSTSRAKGGRTKSCTEEILRLPQDEFEELLKEASQISSKKNASPMLRELYREVNSSNENENLNEQKQGKHYKRNQSNVGEIYADSCGVSQLSGKKKNSNQNFFFNASRNKDDSVKNFNASNVMGKHGSHSQSLQDLPGVASCENMKSAGVGRGKGKLHQKATRANSFTSEVCVSGDVQQIETVYANSCPPPVHKSKIKQKTLKNQRIVPPSESSSLECVKSNVSSNVTYKNCVELGKNNENVRCNSNDDDDSADKNCGDKANAIRIDIMDINDDECRYEKEQVPLLEQTDDLYKDAIVLNNVDSSDVVKNDEGGDAVDETVMFPLQTLKSSSLEEKQQCIGDQYEKPYDSDKQVVSDSVEQNGPSDANFNKVISVKCNSDIHYTQFFNSDEKKKKKKKFSVKSEFSLLQDSDEVKMLDQNGNPLLDNSVTKYGTIPTFLPTMTNVYPANQTITLTDQSESANNVRKNKNRDRTKALVKKAEEIEGYRGNDSLESLLVYINSTAKDRKYSGKQEIGVIATDVKKNVDKKDSKKKDKKKTLSSQNCVGAGAEDDEIASKNCSDTSDSCNKSSSSNEDQDSVVCNNLDSDNIQGKNSRKNDAKSDKVDDTDDVFAANLGSENRSSKSSSVGCTAELTTADDLSVFASDFYTIADPAVQPCSVSEEFREVKSKKPRKSKNRSRNNFGQCTNSSNVRYRHDVGAHYDSCQTRGDILLLDSLQLSHRSRAKSNEGSRRKSTSSMPPSDHSSVDNSDLDSVHSLPVVSGSAPPQLSKLPHTTPSSSSSTPQTSYADIAKMSMLVSQKHQKICGGAAAAAVNVNPIHKPVILKGNEISDGTLEVSPLTVENVAKNDLIETEKNVQNYVAKVESSMSDSKDNYGVKKCNEASVAISSNSESSPKDQEDVPCSHNLVKAISEGDSNSVVGVKTKTVDLPPHCHSFDDQCSGKSVDDLTKTQNLKINSAVTTKNINLNRNYKEKPRSTVKSNEKKTFSRPPVIIMDNHVGLEVNNCYDSEISFGFEVNESLVQMSMNEIPSKNVDDNHKVIQSDDRTPVDEKLECDVIQCNVITPTFLAPAYKPIENFDADKADYNYFDNIKFIKKAWLVVKNDLESGANSDGVVYYNCESN